MTGPSRPGGIRHRGPRSDRRTSFVTDIEAQGTSEGAEFQRRINAAGLDMFPRGLALVQHVAQRMRTTETAAQIADAAGYKVDRCAQLVAQAGHAPLARLLLDRARADESYDAFRSINVDPAPATVERFAKRPIPEMHEVLDELEDAAVRGADWETVAHMYGIEPASLYRRVDRAGLVDRVRFWHPTFAQYRKRTISKPTGLCPEGHPMVTVGGVHRCRPCEVAA